MKSLRYLLVLALLGLSMTACDLLERKNRAFDDAPKIEFFPLKKTVDEPVTGDSTVTAEIQLIGPQRESDLSVSFAVDDSSNAESGTHYNLPSTSATIPANSSQTEISVEVIDNGQDDGGSNYELFLTLQPSDGVMPAENLKTHTLIIKGRDE